MFFANIQEQMHKESIQEVDPWKNEKEFGCADPKCHWKNMTKDTAIRKFLVILGIVMVATTLALPGYAMANGMEWDGNAERLFKESINSLNY